MLVAPAQPSARSVPRQPGRVSDFPDPTINTYSLFARDEIRWNNWTFLPGARYDYTRLKPHLTDEFLATLPTSGNTTVSDKQKNWHRVSPKLGVTYAFNDHYTVRAVRRRLPHADGQGIVWPLRTRPAAMWSSRIRTLSRKEQKLRTGLRGNFDAGNFDVAVFYNKYRDFINEDALLNGNDALDFQAQNIKHATIKGAEVRGRLNTDRFGAPQGLYTQGSVAYAYGRNDDTGQPLNSVNPLTGVFGLGYEQDSYGGLLSWTLVKRKNRVDDTTFFSPTAALRAGVLPAMACST